MKASELIDRLADMCKLMEADLEVVFVTEDSGGFVLNYQPFVDVYDVPADENDVQHTVIALCDQCYVEKEVKLPPNLTLVKNEPKDS